MYRTDAQRKADESLKRLNTLIRMQSHGLMNDNRAIERAQSTFRARKAIAEYTTGRRYF